MVGKHCLEQSTIILSLCSKYTLITSDLVAADSRCSHLSSVQIVGLSSEEMCQYISFFSKHKCLEKVGFTDGSILFIAIRRKCKVAAVDTVSRNVCQELGIGIINIKSEGNQLDSTYTNQKDLRNIRLPRFMKVACL